MVDTRGASLLLAELGKVFHSKLFNRVHYKLGKSRVNTSVRNKVAYCHCDIGSVYDCMYIYTFIQLLVPWVPLHLLYQTHEGSIELVSWQ